MPEKQFVSLASTVCRIEDHLSTEIDDGTVLMSVAQDKYYGLDAISTDVWRRLEKQIRVSDLCATLSDEYDADTETIRRDVLALLERLSAEGLIEVTS